MTKYLLLMTFFITIASAIRADFVWWEGESPIKTNFPKETHFSPSTFESKRHLLSGGDWLTNAGVRDKEEAFAKYEVDVPTDGAYHLWTRKFWKHGPFKWHFNQDSWRICGRDIALADSTYIRTHLGANWVYLGKVNLTEGRNIFELRLLAKEGESLTAAFDAFILTPGTFMPNGKLKPGEKSGLADTGYFPFEPDLDAFSNEALLDLRFLNERFAGEHGFVRRDGLNFTLGNGERVRFWAVNLSANNTGQNRASVDYLARRLAKLGVNMARYHSPIFNRAGDPAKVNKKILDDLFYLITALKREGIYTTLSFYFPLWFEIKPHYGIEGYEALQNKKPFALLYLDERMQEIYKSWAKKLLNTVNPYTGIPLAQDPAIAIIEIVNEDSYFFWTFTKRNIPEIHWRKLEFIYARWLRDRYGSLEEAFSAWGSVKHPDDNIATGRAGLFDAWHMTTDGSRAGGQDKVKRIGDQVRFLTEHQRKFYTSIVKYFKEDLRVGSLISPSNWHVTDGPMLDALERYTYTAGDVIDRHGYFGGKHEGEGSNYSVRVGHTFANRAAVKNPEHLPLQVFQIDGYPHIISEIGWTNPNRFRADFTFLSSAYGALQGLDSLFFFAVNNNFVRDTTMNKFTASSPVVAGTFPAAALQYRRGDVKEAENVIYQILDLEDLYAMKGCGTSTAQALDELRKQDIPKNKRTTGQISKFHPLSFYVGKVVRTFGEQPEKSSQRDLTEFIDRQGKTIRSVTNEILWNYGRGVVRVDTPRSQGVAGFLAEAGEVELADVTIASNNEFASVMVISLDGEPLKVSKNILIQAMTEERPYGFKSEDGEIIDLGGAPLGVKKIDVTVSLKLRKQSARTPKVIALDENGYATRKAVTISDNGSHESLVIRLAADAIYHIVQW